MYLMISTVAIYAPENYEIHARSKAYHRKKYPRPVAIKYWELNNLGLLTSI